MAWTYDLTTDIGKVRLLTGDSLSRYPLLSDEEIQAIIDALGLTPPLSLSDLLRVAAVAADACVGKLWYLADKSIGPSRVTLSQRRDTFQKKADQLFAQVGGRGPFLSLNLPCGGISHAEDDTLDQNSDAKQPVFTLHQVEVQSDEGTNTGGRGSSDPLFNPLLGGSS